VASNFGGFIEPVLTVICPKTSSPENSMRNVINPQLMLDEVDIGAIRLDPKSRDDVPQLLRGLQHIYTLPDLRERVFAILREVIPQRTTGEGKADAGTGRPGMEQWRILVLGVVRLGLNADYDRIHDLVNQHGTLRQMLGHGDWSDKTEYKLQTLKDNLRLFTPEILDRINQEVVKAGHVLVKKVQQKASRLAVTPLSLRRTCTTRPTSICFGMRYARPSRSLRICARPMA
jgi:hypothetical protein